MAYQRRKPILTFYGNTVTVTNPYNSRSFKVSKEDTRLVKNTNWTVGNTNQIEDTVSRRAGCNKKHLYLSRLIMKAKPGEIVKFRNKLPTDLRRSNLVLVKLKRYTRGLKTPVKRAAAPIAQKPANAPEFPKAFIRGYKELMLASKAYKEAAKRFQAQLNLLCDEPCKLGRPRGGKNGAKRLRVFK